MIVNHAIPVNVPWVMLPQHSSRAGVNNWLNDSGTEIPASIQNLWIVITNLLLQIIQENPSSNYSHWPGQRRCLFRTITAFIFRNSFQCSFDMISAPGPRWFRTLGASYSGAHFQKELSAAGLLNYPPWLTLDVLPNKILKLCWSIIMRNP